MLKPARFLSLLILGVGLLTSACGTPRPEKVAPCVPVGQTELVIRWGTEQDSLGTVEQYTLNTKGEIFRYSGPNKTDRAEDFLRSINQSLYCATAKDVSSTFLKTQALSVRGNSMRFVEYRNTQSDVYLRAVWNPDLSTFQSRDMRIQFDELMKLLSTN